jgi:hypothetical protein
MTPSATADRTVSEALASFAARLQEAAELQTELLQHVRRLRIGIASLPATPPPVPERPRPAVPEPVQAVQERVQAVQEPVQAVQGPPRQAASDSPLQVVQEPVEFPAWAAPPPPEGLGRETPPIAAAVSTPQVACDGLVERPNLAALSPKAELRTTKRDYDYFVELEARLAQLDGDGRTEATG